MVAAFAYTRRFRRVLVRLRPLHYYLLGTGSWYAAYGIQSVMFAWLVTLVLRESPEMVGFAQVAMLVPATLLMLIGGSIADHLGPRRVVLVAQACAILPPLALLIALLSDALSFRFMVGYAVAMGIVQAFVTPARDGLLNDVAEGRIQRTVVRTTMIQFAVQFVGYTIAGFAEVIGGHVVVATQVAVVAFGVWAFVRVRVEAQPRPLAETDPFVVLANSVVLGFKTVVGSPAMRAVVLQNVAMGICFMGSFIVTLPLLVRERYDGASADLAMVNACNSLGLVIAILLLMRFGDVRRQGRALLLAQGSAGLVLMLGGASLGFGQFLVCVFLWGACGGVAMSMSRTIMQEQAPADQRGRVMGFFSFSFMGAGPVGALLCGYLSRWYGPGNALIVMSLGMFAVVVLLAFASRLWRVSAHETLV